jgi:drug/metabolite transporter (DMT)-like permease
MRLILLTALTMIAFAANSILNRLAVSSGSIDPESFAVIRLISGVVALLALARMRGARTDQTWRNRLVGGGSLTLYMLGFSLAYSTLDAGLGALILFGVVQVSMFGWGLARGQSSSGRQVFGATLALTGLAWVLWPGEDASAEISGALFMALAGLGWAIYSLIGRGAGDPLGATADNFRTSLVMTLAALMLLGWQLQVTVLGAFLAILAGAVTSGMGYAMWYSVLPRLTTSVAATIQLSVPVLAMIAGVLMLGEDLSMQLVLGGLAVIGGIALVVGAPIADAVKPR